MSVARNIPNLLTLSRIAILPAFMYAIFAERYPSAFCLFVIGAVTDFLDGFVARKMNLITPLGKFLDPLADKLFFVFSLAVFTVKGFVPVWFFSIISVRDFCVATGSLIYIRRHGMSSISPLITGKIVNVIQFVVIAGILVERTFSIDSFARIYPPLFITGAACSIWSFFGYFRRFIAVAR